jgi:Dictyostelium (slime mold) repeat
VSLQTTNHSFDELARGLASGSISRGRALRLMGAALVGGVLGSLGGVAAADEECKPLDKKCRKDAQCCSGKCESRICVPACQVDIECDDGDACTVDSCVDGMCVHTLIECDDGNACTEDFCIPEIGCVSEEINCDDGNACTEDFCFADQGCVHEEIDCDDGNACTRDFCIDGMCMHELIVGPPCDTG